MCGWRTAIAAALDSEMASAPPSFESSAVRQVLAPPITDVDAARQTLQHVESEYMLRHGSLMKQVNLHGEYKQGKKQRSPERCAAWRALRSASAGRSDVPSSACRLSAPASASSAAAVERGRIGPAEPLPSRRWTRWELRAPGFAAPRVCTLPPAPSFPRRATPSAPALLATGVWSSLRHQGVGWLRRARGAGAWRGLGAPLDHELYVHGKPTLFVEALSRAW
jgi:hypothetical protein